MKAIAYAAASLLTSSLLLACPASAQMPGGPGPGPAPAPGPSGYGPGPNGYESGYQDGMRDGMGHKGCGWGMTEHMKGMHGMEETGGEAGSGPRVRLTRGNATIALKCAADDFTEDCVNAAIILLDHAASEKKESVQAKAPPAVPIAPPPPPPPAGPGAPQPH